MQQLKRGFLTHSRHPWNIITRIAHKALQVNDLLRRQIVFLADLLRPVQLHFSYAFTHKRYGCMFRSQLQHVLIPGYDHHFTSGSICLTGNRSDNIVSLIAVDLKLRNPKITQQTF
ncbi:hypothetical protein D3C75_277110 [compost metagenome]